MATTTPNFGWTVPTSSDLVKDGAVAIETLGDSIDASLVDLKGGTTGQVLTKASGTDMDFSWTAVDPLIILDAKGDLITATAADTPARLAVGTNGQVLTADSTAATGLKWVTAGGGGKVLQVVQGTTNTATGIATTTYTDTGLTVSITPSLATSKVLILVSQQFTIDGSTRQIEGSFRLMRGATNIYNAGGANDRSLGMYITPTSSYTQKQGYESINYLDSPATTSATTYKTQAARKTGTDTITAQSDNAVSSIIALEIGA